MMGACISNGHDSQVRYRRRWPFFFIISFFAKLRTTLVSERIVLVRRRLPLRYKKTVERERKIGHWRVEIPIKGKTREK